MNKEQIKYLLDNINCEVKSNINWIEPLGLDRDTWKSLLEYIQQKDKEIERLNNIINEIYTKANDTNITSLDLRDYILNNLGVDKE